MKFFISNSNFKKKFMNFKKKLNKIKVKFFQILNFMKDLKYFIKYIKITNQIQRIFIIIVMKINLIDLDLKMIFIVRQERVYQILLLIALEIKIKNAI